MKKVRSAAAKLSRQARLLARSQRGGTAVEYAMIVAVIVLAVAAAISQTAGVNSAIWANVSTSFAASMPAD